MNIESAKVLASLIRELGPSHGDAQRAARIIVRVDRYRQARHYVAAQVRTWGMADGPGIFISTLGRTQVTAHALAQHIAERARSRHVVIVGNNSMADALMDELGFLFTDCRS